MKVGDSVRLAIDDFERGETESAMLYACNAVDGSSAKLYPKLANGKRFTKLIRDNYATFGLMAVRGLDAHETRWPVPVRSTLSTKTLIEWPDTADLIWVIHRCNHGHGDEVPSNFALIDDNIGIASELHVERGVVRLPWNTVFGLLAIAIGEPVNRGQIAGDGQYLTWARLSCGSTSPTGGDTKKHSWMTYRRNTRRWSRWIGLSGRKTLPS